MNIKLLMKFMSRIVVIEAAFMLPSLIVAICQGESSAIFGFGYSILAILLFSAIIYLVFKKVHGSFGAKDGLVCVGASWIFLSLFGCLPFVISGAIPQFVDALFETASGFTTTGSTILVEIESLPMSILLWRSMTHWLGGMGVLVFMLAVSSTKDKDKGVTMHLLRAESPGPSVGKLVPKMKTSAMILYLIYIALTVLDAIFLLFGGMSVFEAVTTALGTAGTGGFAVKNDSLASYSSYIQNVTTVFMILFGINFNCYFALCLGKIKDFFKDEELRVYLIIVAVSTAIIAWNIRGFYDTIGECIKHSAFQVAATISTTGFMTADFDVWPALSKGILFVLMFIGGCAGSTGGGYKVARFMLLSKNLKRSLRQMVHPGKVEVVRLGGNVVEEDTLHGVLVYTGVYFIMMFAGFLLISINGFSVITNISAVVTCFNNVGPGFEVIGPTCNFSVFSPFSKVVLVIMMLAGRLEIFPILMIFARSTWKKA